MNFASTRRIVIAGESGVGKSSVINLVTGRYSAVTGNGVRGVTVGTECHDWIYDTQVFRLWDTPGLNEGSSGTVSPKDAEDALRSLLKELRKGGGVHLLVICMRGLSYVTLGMKQTYDTIVRIRDKVAPDVPLVAVITELERRSASPDIILSMENWWTSNAAKLSEFNMMFSGHACITTLPDDCHPEVPGRRKLCQELVRRLFLEGVKPVRNIVVAGDIGAENSSLVSLAAGLDPAAIAYNARGRTIRTEHHDWVDDSQTFRLWDTPGLNEELPFLFPTDAQDALQSLLRKLSKKGGVHLVVICMHGFPKVTIGMKRTYDTIVRIRDKVAPDIPLVAVIIDPEEGSASPDVTPSMEDWWTSNVATLSDFNMAFSGHACITTLPENYHAGAPGHREWCQGLVRNLIMNQSLHPYAAPSRDLHVLLFGETGVGKSSLINLLAGWQIASVSSDSEPCTLDASEYQFQLGFSTIRLWDTVGLEEPEKGPNNYVGAIEKAVQLIRRLNATGGISLFLFCIRGNRIKMTTESNYRLFYEVLGRKEVPVALAVTHLEREENMEDWWQRNVEKLERRGLHSAGHACITTLEDHPRYGESRDILQGLLSRFDDQGKFSMPPEAWIGRSLKGLSSLVDKSFPRGKDLARILVKRCHMDPDVAKWVAVCIDSDDV